MGLAVIAAEDQKFPEHWGLTWRQSRKRWRTMNATKTASVGHRHYRSKPQRICSCGTVVAGYEKGWKRVDAGDGNGLEQKRILTVYLNIAEFGDGVFGVEAAAQRYFNKPASRLSMSEAALRLPSCLTPSALRLVPRPGTCEAVRRGSCARCVS